MCVIVEEFLKHASTYTTMSTILNLIRVLFYWRIKFGLVTEFVIIISLSNKLELFTIFIQRCNKQKISNNYATYETVLIV